MRPMALRAPVLVIVCRGTSPCLHDQRCAGVVGVGWSSHAGWGAPASGASVEIGSAASRRRCRALPTGARQFARRAAIRRRAGVAGAQQPLRRRAPRSPSPSFRKQVATPPLPAARCGRSRQRRCDARAGGRCHQESSAARASVPDLPGQTVGASVLPTKPNRGQAFLRVARRQVQRAALPPSESVDPVHPAPGVSSAIDHSVRRPPPWRRVGPSSAETAGRFGGSCQETGFGGGHRSGSCAAVPACRQLCR